jgi:uncharacterized caspase-like protein
MHSLFLLGYLLAAFVFATNALAQPDRIALVIGNSHYLHTPALPNPVNDAREVAKVLRAIGFEVTAQEDLTRAPMAQHIHSFFVTASSARISVLFYAGHGLQSAGKNYIVPVDAKLESANAVETELIEVDALLANLDRADRANIVILDACRDNPLASQLQQGLGSSRSIQRGFAAYSPAATGGPRSGTGVLIAFSTAPGMVALDGVSVNSPFTTALIKYLTVPGLEIRQMLTRVRADVAAATGNKQIPWDNSSLFGDVFLTGSSVKIQKERLEVKSKDCFTFNGQQFCN